MLPKEEYISLIKALVEIRKLPFYSEAIEDLFINRLDYLWYKELSNNERIEIRKEL